MLFLKTWHQHHCANWTQFPIIKTNIIIALLLYTRVCEERFCKNIAQGQTCGRWHWAIYRIRPTVISPCCCLEYISVSDLHLTRTSKDLICILLCELYELLISCRNSQVFVQSYSTSCWATSMPFGK